MTWTRGGESSPIKLEQTWPWLSKGFFLACGKKCQKYVRPSFNSTIWRSFVLKNGALLSRKWYGLSRTLEFNKSIWTKVLEKLFKTSILCEAIIILCNTFYFLIFCYLLHQCFSLSIPWKNHKMYFILHSIKTFWRVFLWNFHVNDVRTNTCLWCQFKRMFIKTNNNFLDWYGLRKGYWCQMKQ